MKLLRIAVWVIIASVLAALATVRGQQSTPPIIMLNPETSATWQRVDQALLTENDRHQREIARLTELKVVMLQAAGVPESYWPSCKVDKTGVACARPTPSPSSAPK